MSPVRLLDINVLIALVDPWHVFHVPAIDWMKSTPIKKWATCPLTENGFLRIFGHPSYKNGPGSPAAALPFLRQMHAAAGHEFWTLDLSFVTEKMFRTLEKTGPSQLSDIYLLGLAAVRHGRLATFDTTIQTASIDKGDKHLEVITTS